MVPIRSLLQRYWKEVAGVVAAVALLLKLDRLVAAIREAVAVGLVPGGSGRFLLSAGWGWGLAIAAVALAASSLLCVRPSLRGPRPPTGATYQCRHHGEDPERNDEGRESHCLPDVSARGTPAICL